MHAELVERRHWISERHFLHALNYCMILPGPEAQQLATYIGWLMHRTWGGIAAGVLFVLPSLLILIVISWFYITFGHVSVVAGLFYGIKPAVTAIVLQAAYRIGLRTLKNQVLWAIALISFAAIAIFNVPFPAILLAAALAGFIGGQIVPTEFMTSLAHSKPKLDRSYGSAIIDDTILPPEHTQFRWSRLIVVIVVCALLWLIPIALLTNRFGWDGTLTQLSWFFTKAALLTFGGAYAVLPYVYQGAVEYYGWLTPAQMIDGLALGETTPGPLIMVVAFVGFIAGHADTLFGAEFAFMAGAVAAVVVTWFTFLPSFLFILAGGPLVEATHGKLKFTAPLTAITAAVVGVIFNLVLFFAYHVLWPEGFSAPFEWPAGLITLAACITLFYFNRNVIQVIGGCAVVGLAYSLFWG